MTKSPKVSRKLMVSLSNISWPSYGGRGGRASGVWCWEREGGCKDSFLCNLDLAFSHAMAYGLWPMAYRRLLKQYTEEDSPDYDAETAAYIPLIHVFNHARISQAFARVSKRYSVVLRIVCSK